MSGDDSLVDGAPLDTTDLSGPKVADLFKEREARGVTAALLARLAYIIIGSIAIPLTSTSAADVARSLALAGLGLGATGLALYWVRRRIHITWAGLIGVGFDVLGIFSLPASWYAAVGGYAEVPASFVAKTDVPYVAFVLIMINTLTLRPLYPLIVAAALAFVQAATLIVAVLDDRTVLTLDPRATMLGPGLHIPFMLWRLVSVILVGLLATGIARIARLTVVDAVRAEVRRSRLLARQAERIAAVQLSSLTRLVAGLAHEINTPLGAIISGASSATTAADRLETSITDADDLEELRAGRAPRVLNALRDASAASARAGARLSEVVEALKTFSRLDEGEWQQANLNQTLDATVALIPAELRGDVEVRMQRGALPAIPCRAREIGQVFMTVIENALEALDGRGRLEIQTRLEPRVAVVIIEDDGPGMTESIRRGLFELRFQPKKGRMGMGLGLPVGRRIVRQHGGDIEVDTRPGEGTRVTITLPRSPAVDGG